MEVVKIIIIIILIVINVIAFIYIYKNDNDDVNYDKYCKLIKDETRYNIDIIRKNDEKINKLNDEINLLVSKNK